MSTPTDPEAFAGGVQEEVDGAAGADEVLDAETGRVSQVCDG